MSTWIRTLFGQTGKALDIFNVGRLVFYTAAGFMLAYPAVMTVALVVGAPDKTYFAGVRWAAVRVSKGEWEIFALSVISGFVLAKIGFATIMAPVFKKVTEDLADYEPHPHDFNYRYPQLRNNPDDEDYQAWLISEYFRYVEIATLLPLGAVCGLGFLGVFTVAYLVCVGLPQAADLSAIYPALVSLIVIAMMFGLLCFYVWPAYWRPRVLVPTMRTYVRAKISLIKGFVDFGLERAEDATQSDDSEED